MLMSIAVITDEDIIQEFRELTMLTPIVIRTVQAAMDVMQQYSLYLESADVPIQLTRVCSSIDAAIAKQEKRPRY